MQGNYAKVWKQQVSRRENFKCKGPEVGKDLRYARISKKASVPIKELSEKEGGKR
jgi:hypothetical protein